MQATLRLECPCTLQVQQHHHHGPHPGSMQILFSPRRSLFSSSCSILLIAQDAHCCAFALWQKKPCITLINSSFICS